MTNDDGSQRLSSTEPDDRATASLQHKILPEPPRAAHPVDTGWAWIIVVGTFGVHFFSFGYIRSFGILFLEFQKSFSASSAETAAVSGVQFGAYSLATLLVTNVILKRVSIRRCCISGCVLQSLGIALNGIVPGIRYLIITQGILFGIGNALVYCPALIILSHYFNKKRALATVVATCGVSAGGIILPLLIRHLVDTYGLRGGLLLLAAIMLNQAVFSSLFTPISDYKFGSEEEGPHKLLVNGSGPPLEDLTKTKHIPEPSELRTSENSSSNVEELYSHDDETLPHEDEASKLLKQQTFSKAYQPSQPSQPTQKRELSICNGEVNRLKETENSKQRNNEIHSPLSSSPLNAKHSPNQQGELLTSSENNLDSLSDRQANSDWRDHSEMGHLAERAMIEDRCLLPGAARKPSLQEAVVNVLSASSVDLHGGLGSLKHLEASVQRDIRNDGTTQGEQHNPEERRRCRLPPVTKTVAFWAILVFFACGGPASGLPTVFMPPLATEKNMVSISTIMLIASAITELFGRLIPGLIIQAGWMRASSVLIVPLLACATLYQFTAFYNDFGTLLMMAGFSGIFSGGFWSTQSLVVIEVFGMDSLGPMLGFYFLILGLSTGASHPIAGILRDVSGTYVATFHFFGAMYYTAVLMLIIITFINRSKSEKDAHVSNSEKDAHVRNSEKDAHVSNSEKGEHRGISENNGHTSNSENVKYIVNIENGEYIVNSENGEHTS